jgi:hypothetical protein
MTSSGRASNVYVLAHSTRGGFDRPYVGGGFGVWVDDRRDRFRGGH